MQKSIAVVYLVWLPYDISLLDGFLKSYKKYKTNLAHDFYVLFNGRVVNTSIDEHLKLIQLNCDKHVNYLELPGGQDIDAYFYAANKIKHELILFFNSFSKISAHFWLEIYCDNFKNDVGLISATASNQSYYSSVFQTNNALPDFRQGIISNFRKYKLFVKAFFYWRFLFKPFPNPHVRTNAFMIRRELFLQLNYRRLKSKFEAYQFESGRKSLTNQVLNKGYKVVVVDKHGEAYESPNWAKSKTFWISKQENLLVSDNQTQIYADAVQGQQEKMRKLAWGL